jgi:hypothetical protein
MTNKAFDRLTQHEKPSGPSRTSTKTYVSKKHTHTCIIWELMMSCLDADEQ